MTRDFAEIGILEHEVHLVMFPSSVLVPDECLHDVVMLEFAPEFNFVNNLFLQSAKTKTLRRRHCLSESHSLVDFDRIRYSLVGIFVVSVSQDDRTKATFANFFAECQETVQHLLSVGIFLYFDPFVLKTVLVRVKIIITFLGGWDLFSSSSTASHDRCQNSKILVVV